MKLQKDQRGSTVAIVLVIVVVLVIGAIAFKMISMNKDNDSMSAAKSDTTNLNTAKASDLRATMVTLGVEHMILTDNAVKETLAGATSATATGAALYANGDDIGAAVGSIYGKDAQTTFDTVWKIHLDQFVAYAGAASKNDEAGKKAALDTIDTQYTKPLSAFLAKANPNLPEKTLYTALNDHVQMTAALIDNIAKGDYTAEQSDLKEANTHIASLFSTLAGGIVKQYPEKFQD